jgi:hypothetical protein
LNGADEPIDIHGCVSLFSKPRRSRIRLGFWEANNFAAFLPLSAFLEKLDPLKAFQDIALSSDGAGPF